MAGGGLEGLERIQLRQAARHRQSERGGMRKTMAS
jgi:hypothetical protein